MRPGVATTLAGIAVIVCTTATAHADADERRISVDGRAAVATERAFGTTADALAVGGALGVSYGPASWIELGLQGCYLGRTDMTFANAQAAGVGGAGFVLYADLHAVEAAATVRFIAGPELSPSLSHLHPVVELRAGAAVRMLSAPELFSPDGSFVVAPPATHEMEPVVGAGAGLLYRVGDRVQLGVVASASVAQGHRVMASSLELSLFSY